MRITSTTQQIASDDFARRFAMRAGKLMWLLGAGASAASGIPTAWDMIWEFKQQLYVSQRRVSAKTVSDLSNAAIRSLLQSYIDAAGRFPAVGAPDEYAVLFEAVWPNEKDRRAYIDGKITGAKPSYGHVALATLMKARFTHLVWTTNFDPLIADACAKLFDGTGALTSVALDASDLALETITEQRWPIEVKLHGDFRSRRLKNTGDELRQQDAKLRQVFVDCCRREGLVVVGYSGRDDSIMDALGDVLEHTDPFPGGLFWLHRGDEPPLARVTDLLSRAAGRGIEGGLVSIDSFDETLRDLVRLIGHLDTATLDQFASERQRRSAPPRLNGRTGWPVVRLNAIPILSQPSVCRRVACSVGGFAEVQAAIEKAGVDVIAARRQIGVLAFGSDADVRKVLSPFAISDFDLHSLETNKLRYDSSERGFLKEAATRALAREHDLQIVRRGHSNLLVPQDAPNNKWQPLGRLVGPLNGAVRGDPNLKWREGIGVRLDWADERLWLLIEPKTVFENLTSENRFVASDFARERTVRRYNRQLNDIIAFWATTLAGEGKSLSALGIADGVDAVFQFSPTTAFSRRIGA